MNKKSWPGLVAIFVLAVSAVVFDAWLHECHRIELQVTHSDGDMTSTYYWKWEHKSDSHGFCAAMYSGEDGGLWVVEKPEPHEPTAIYEFNSRDEAQGFAESRCHSHDKQWEVVTN